ncbi:hypothetical protein [Streptomyces sp. NPDC006638]|uniref:hypothetical protein n=1 Tax=Streptomyces sp. NPDC006638 TaxID=3157183 RepID=UPI0033B28D6F
MAVTEAQWWGAWWGWMAWWLAAVAGLVTLAALAVRRLSARRRRRLGRASYSPLYLDDEAVEDHYKFGNHTAALEKAVEERRSRSVGLWASLPVVSWFTAKRDSSQEVFVSYIQESEPISVVGMLLSVFEREDAIVHVRLRSGTFTPNRALVRELARREPDEGHADGVPLSEISEFVMVEAKFESLPGGDDKTRIMRAAYRDGERTAHLRVVLRADRLRSADKQLPSGQFQARCLGKVTSWNPATGETVLEHPIAVFR